MGTRVSVPAPERKEVAEKKRVAKRKGPSTSGPRTRSKAAKEGSEAKIISEHCVEDECDQLRCEFRALKKEQAKLNRKISEKERRLKDEELEEQLRPLRRETQQVQRNLRQKRKRLKELCDAIEVENAYQRLDKLPPEVWEKILDHLEDADLFPLALSSRYFRKKQKDLVARTRQNGPGSRRVLKTRIRPKFEKSQPASAEYIRFCSKHKLSRDHIYDKIGHNHFRCLAAFHGHLPLLQELLEPFRSKRTKISGEYSFPQYLFYFSASDLFPPILFSTAPGGSQWTTSSFQKKLTPKSGLNCGCPPRIIRVPNPESQILDAACKGGQLEIMRWLRSEGVYLGDCSKAAKAGHLEVLKWLRSEGCPWDEHTCAGAAEKGHLEVLKWLRSEGCPWNEEACARAIKGGHLEILKWLRSEGCPWDASACSCIPGAALTPEPLQYLQVTIRSCKRACASIPRAALAPEPLQYLQMTLTSC